MARFDVHSFNSKTVPLVVVVQADLFDELHSRVVIPLAPASKARTEALPRLNPVLKIKNKAYVLRTTDIATITKADLGPTVENIEDRHRQDITDSLDFLFQGF